MVCFFHQTNRHESSVLVIQFAQGPVLIPSVGQHPPDQKGQLLGLKLPFRDIDGRESLQFLHGVLDVEGRVGRDLMRPHADHSRIFVLRDAVERTSILLAYGLHSILFPHLFYHLAVLYHLECVSLVLVLLVLLLLRLIVRGLRLVLVGVVLHEVFGLAVAVDALLVVLFGRTHAHGSARPWLGYLNTILYKNNTGINFSNDRSQQVFTYRQQSCSLSVGEERGRRLQCIEKDIHGQYRFAASALFFGVVFHPYYIKYIQMTQNDEKTQHQQAQLCPKCKDMFGHANYDFLCSMCYKKQKNLATLVTPLPPSPAPNTQRSLQPLHEPEPLSLKRPLPPQEEPSQPAKGKCTKCSKKTGMLGFSCKHCSLQFCKFHRLPEEHDCGADFVSLGRKKIKNENPVILSKKIEDI